MDSRKPLRIPTGRLALALAVAAVVSPACASSGQVRFGTDHFLAVFDRAWTMSAEARPAGECYLFRRGGDDPEVHVCAWHARQPIADAPAEALRRLASEADLSLPSGEAHVAACNGAGRAFTLLGNQAAAFDLMAADHWSTTVAATQADGSLVAVIVRRPVASGAICDRQQAADALVQSLLTGFGPAPDPWMQPAQRGAIPADSRAVPMPRAPTAPRS